MKQLYYAFQNIIRGKDSNIIKIVSITCGLLVSIILFAKIAFELSYDTWFPNSDRLYVVKMAWSEGGKAYAGSTLYPIGSTIQQHFPEMVENTTTLNDFTCKVGNGIKKQSETCFFVDSTFFQTMEIPVVKGNITDLTQPDALFIS